MAAETEQCLRINAGLCLGMFQSSLTTGNPKDSGLLGPQLIRSRSNLLVRSVFINLVPIIQGFSLINGSGIPMNQSFSLINGSGISIDQSFSLINTRSLKKIDYTFNPLKFSPIIRYGNYNQ